MSFEGSQSEMVAQRQDKFVGLSIVLSASANHGVGILVYFFFSASQSGTFNQCSPLVPFPPTATSSCSTVFWNRIDSTYFEKNENFHFEFRCLSFCDLRFGDFWTKFCHSGGPCLRPAWLLPSSLSRLKTFLLWYIIYHIFMIYALDFMPMLRKICP